MANNKFYGYTPKTSKPSKQIEKAWSGEESGGSAYADLGNRLERVNPHEFKKGMDFELTAMGISRLQESTIEEREKATESVLKNLEETPHHYTALITYNTLYRNIQGAKPTFKSWLKKQEDETHMQEIKVGDSSTNHKEDKMKELKEAIKRDKQKNALKKAIKQIVEKKLYEQSAKQAAMADMEDSGEKEGGKKGKGKAKKDKPVRKDRFDREEEAIKDILFRVDAKGKKSKEEGDYTKDDPAPGSMLFIKDQLLDTYKNDIKNDPKLETPKDKEEAYNTLQKEANDEFEDAFDKFNKEFDTDNALNIYTKGQPLFQTIKNLQERLKLGLDKARAGVEEEARGIRREVASSQMTREEALRLLEIVKENGISLREGTENIKVYYEIAKAAYLEGVANALKL